MKTLTEEQQLIFDKETENLEHTFLNVSSQYIESLGFKSVRFHEMANLRGDEADLEVFEDNAGQRIAKLCVTQFTHTEGDLLHISCYAPAAIMPLLEKESNSGSR
ncbi:MAG: hypothetical protein IPN08_12535 [Bacteroidales bacterium]|nr:hypothetical protein [Bacteroidales bacterium]MBK9358204.1 hypothetical protein [Bacteroidales bacterium]